MNLNVRRTNGVDVYRVTRVLQDWLEAGVSNTRLGVDEGLLVRHLKGWCPQLRDKGFNRHECLLLLVKVFQLALLSQLVDFLSAQVVQVFYGVLSRAAVVGRVGRIAGRNGCRLGA